MKDDPGLKKGVFNLAGTSTHNSHSSTPFPIPISCRSFKTKNARSSRRRRRAATSRSWSSMGPLIRRKPSAPPSNHQRRVGLRRKKTEKRKGIKRMCIQNKRFQTPSPLSGSSGTKETKREEWTEIQREEIKKKKSFVVPWRGYSKTFVHSHAMDLESTRAVEVEDAIQTQPGPCKS